MCQTYGVHEMERELRIWQYLTWDGGFGVPVSANCPLSADAPWTVLLGNVDPEHASLVVRGLIPARSYQFRLCPVNDVGKGQFSKDTERVSLPEEPPTAPPQNVIASGRTNQSIMIQWQPPPESHQNGALKGYIIRYCLSGLPVGYQYRNISNADINNLLLEDLIIWTNYEIEVAAFNSAGLGVYSLKVTEWTLQGVHHTVTAPSSPQLIAWEPAQEDDVTVVTVRPNFQDRVHVGLISGLKKFTGYLTSVLCFTTPGDGPRSAPQHVWTHEDVPGPLGHLSFDDILDTSLKVTWQEPTEKNGILTESQNPLRVVSGCVITHGTPESQNPLRVVTTCDNECTQDLRVVGGRVITHGTPESRIPAYQITHRLNTTKANTATVEVLNPSVRQYTATGLRAESVYLFRITAQTRKGWGEAAEALVVTTEKRERPQPPSKPVVQQADVKARGVLLSWEPGSDGLSPLRYYTVQTRELPRGEWSVHSASVSHNATSSVVDRLKPFTSYKFRVKATNDIGDSEYSEETESLTTLQDAPDEAPTILSVTPHTTTSVLIRWQAPAEDKVNGILLGFRVRYRELAYDGLRSFTARSINNPSAKWAELTYLNKHKRYEIRLSVYNAAGEGPASAPQEVFVGEADPIESEGSPRSLSPRQIFFWGALRRNETEKVRTLFLPESSVKIKNLTGFTTYLISVAAFNAAGDGPRSLPTQGQTQQAAPSSPASIRFSELTTTSVNVSWDAPVFPNGILEGYRLVYEPCTPVDGISKIVTVDVKGNSPLWMKLKDLAEGVTYRFRIRAKTFTYGPDLEANVTTGPGEGAPGPPGEPFISRYSSAITIHWSSGDPGKSPITRYIIEARPSDEGLWDILIKDIPKEVTSYTFSMDILKPGVSYDFRVIAVNDYGYGTPSAPSPSVSAQKANPFYEEWWFLVVIALIGLIFILLLVFALIIRGQSKKYAKKSDSAINPKTSALGHGEMVSLDESRFPALELNDRRLFLKKLLLLAGSDSEYEVDQNQQKSHSFVNHYISDPTYYNSWRRQQKGISRAQAYSYAGSEPGDPEPCVLPSSNCSQEGSLYRPKSSRTPTPQQPPSLPAQPNPIYRPPSSLAPASRAPIAGFSSFV
ncbi:hypothetical protein FKM82_019129 [Ascaphus truei]